MEFNELGLGLNMEPLPARRAIRIGERIDRDRPFFTWWPIA